MQAILYTCKYLGIRTIPNALEPSELETAVPQTILTAHLPSVAEVEEPKRTQRSPGEFPHLLRTPTLAIEENRH